MAKHKLSKKGAQKESDPLQTANEESINTLREYREKLVDGILEDEKDYHTVITYLAGGALGLFLTINEKFFHLTDSNNFWLFIVSVVLLFFTLLLFVVNNILDIRASEQLRDISDDMIDKNFYDADRLEKIWRKKIRQSRILTYLRFALLLAGIAAEVIFIMMNMNFQKPTGEKEPPVMRIEILRSKDSSAIIFDSATKSVELKFK
jgi:hypothetical protein